MSDVLMTIPAHFDGTQIQLDVDVELKPDTRLLVTILGEDISHELLVQNAMKTRKMLSMTSYKHRSHSF
jgi:hypothetical protein